MSKIIELTSENVKRLSAVKITPNGNMVVIGGDNGQGKSSVLDSIMYALAGNKAIPAAPLRKGQKFGKVVLKLDADESRSLSAMTVVRTFAASGKTTLEITSEDGYRAPTPQTILNDICGRIAFDPLEFTRMKPKDQADTLRSVVGLDFTAQDQERKKLYDQRTIITRDGKQLKARWEAIEVEAETPDEEVDVESLLIELKAANANNAAAQKKQDAVESAAVNAHTIVEQISELEAELVKCREELAKREQAFIAAKEAATASKEIDTAHIEAKLAAATEINRSVQRKQEKATMGKELDKLREQACQFGIGIEAIDKAKTEAMGAARWPVEGLGFSDDGVTLNDLPFEQASSAEQLRVSVAMGLAMNPGLRVLLIRDGSLLDENSLALLAKIAEEQDGQVWLERVSKDDKCSVIIQDGAVAEVEEAVGV